MEKKKLKSKGGQAFPKINKTQNYTHTPTLQDHFPRAKSPMNYEDSCVRYHQNSSMTKKTKKGFCAFPLINGSWCDQRYCPAGNNSRKKKSLGHMETFSKLCSKQKDSIKTDSYFRKSFQKFSLQALLHKVKPDMVKFTSVC